MAANGARGSRSRRVRLPGISELLRPAPARPVIDGHRQASGRETHTQKITVYLSAEELLDLERGAADPARVRDIGRPGAPGPGGDRRPARRPGGPGRGTALLAAAARQRNANGHW